MYTMMEEELTLDDRNKQRNKQQHLVIQKNML